MEQKSVPAVSSSSRLNIDSRLIQRMSAAIALVSLAVLVLAFSFLPGFSLSIQSAAFVIGLAVAFFVLYIVLPRIYLNETFLMIGDALFVGMITYFAVIAGQYGILILFLYFIIIVADALKYPLSEYVFVVLVTLQAAYLYVIVWAPFEARIKVGILILFTAATLSIAIFVWYFVYQTMYERSMRYLLERKSKYLQSMNDHLKAVDKMRASMLKVTSHEFQTPLAAIKNSLSLLNSHDFGKLTPKQLKLVQMAVQNNERLTLLMRNLLDTARIQSGDWKMIKSDVRFGELVDRLAKDYLATTAEMKIAFAIHIPKEPLLMRGDAHFLNIACHNIIDNAIKYTPEGGSVTVTVGSDKNNVFMKVADSGIGISEEMQKHLFAQFNRSEKAIETRPDGYGIGLYYCKLIVDKHKGKITVDSVEGKGTTFTLSFPKH
jgi:signal transduction histidine kinase